MHPVSVSIQFMKWTNSYILNFGQSWCGVCVFVCIGVCVVRSSLCFCRSFMQVHWRRDWLGFKLTSSARNMELSSPASARQRKRPMSSRSSTRPSGKNLKSSPKATLCVFVMFEGVICVSQFLYSNTPSQNRLEVMFVRFKISLT